MAGEGSASHNSNVSVPPTPSTMSAARTTARWRLVTLAGVAGLTAALAILGASHFGTSDPIVQYGAWLLVFSIWMAWFVYAAREWVRGADF